MKSFGLTLVMALGVAMGIAQAQVTIGPAIRAPGNIATTEYAKFDETDGSFVVRFKQGSASVTQRVVTSTGATTTIPDYSGKAQPAGISIDGRDFYFVDDSGAPITEVLIKNPKKPNAITGLTSASMSYFPWQYDGDRQIFGGTRQAIRFARAVGASVQYSMPNGGGTYGPLSGYLDLQPSAMTPDGRFMLMTNVAHATSPNRVELVNASGPVTTFPPLVSSIQAVDISDSGSTLLLRRSTGAWVMDRWQTSTSVTLNTTGVTFPYMVGLSDDGKIAFGAEQTSIGVVPSPAYLWDDLGNRFSLANLINVTFATAIPVATTLNCITDVSADNRSFIVACTDPIGPHYRLITFPRPLTLPAVRYESRSISLPVGTNPVTKAVNQNGRLAGYYTLSSIFYPFVEKEDGSIETYSSVSVPGILFDFANDGRAFGNTSIGAIPVANQFAPGYVRTVMSNVQGFARATSPDGEMTVGWAENALIPDGAPALWTSPSATSIERPFGNVTGDLYDISVDKTLMVGAIGTGVNAAQRLGVNSYVTRNLPTTGIPSSGAFATREGLSSFPVFAGSDNGTPVYWRWNAASLATAGAFDKVTLTGASGTARGITLFSQGNSLATAVGMQAFGMTGSGTAWHYTPTFGRITASRVQADSKLTDVLYVEDYKFGGRVGATGVDLRPLSAKPWVPIRGQFNLQSFNPDAPLPSQVGTLKVRSFPLGQFPTDQAIMTISEDHAFRVNAPIVGKSDLILKFTHYLSKEIWDVNVDPEKGVILPGTLTLVNGDAVPDDEVGPGDLQLVLDWFGQSSGWSNGLYPDLDGDGEVGPGDLQIVLDNFGFTGGP